MCRAKTPKVEKSAPPPMMIPETQDEQVRSTARRQRQRAATAYGRQSTILGGGMGGMVGGPTAQAKTLLGS